MDNSCFVFIYERSHRNFEKGKILYRTFFGKSLEREKCGGREAFSNCRRGIFLDDRFHGIDLTIVCRVSSRVTLVFHVGATFSCCDDAFSSRSFHRLKPDLQLIPNNLLKGNIRYVTRFFVTSILFLFSHYSSQTDLIMPGCQVSYSKN